MGHTTKEIVFNLNDTGRVSTGNNRKDMNVQSYVDIINSKKVQEMIKNGDMFGYIGHEVREAYGDIPPDTVIHPITGKQITIEPAFCTIALRADDKGNVYSKHKFTENKYGEAARSMYSSNMGGFSSVFFTKNINGERHADGFAGFDQVKMPNFTENRGDGQLDSVEIKLMDSSETTYDSATQTGIALQQAREKAVWQSIDNLDNDIFAAAQIEDSANLIAEQQIQIDSMNAKAENVRINKQQRAEQARSANIGKSTTFADIQRQWDSASEQIAVANTSYDSGKTEQTNEKARIKSNNTVMRNKRGFF